MIFSFAGIGDLRRGLRGVSGLGMPDMSSEGEEGELWGCSFGTSLVPLFDTEYIRSTYRTPLRLPFNTPHQDYSRVIVPNRVSRIGIYQLLIPTTPDYRSPPLRQPVTSCPLRLNLENVDTVLAASYFRIMITIHFGRLRIILSQGHRPRNIREDWPEINNSQGGKLALTKVRERNGND